MQKSKFTKLLCLVLSLVMILSTAPLAAFAEDTELLKEVLPFNKNNAAMGGTFGTHYYYEGTYFTVTADAKGTDTGVVGGSQWYKLTVTAKSNTVTIDSIEAVIGDYGEAYAKVGISGGEKEETDINGVENGSVVHINNINTSSFYFGDGVDAVAFKDITVYFTNTEPECEHSFTDEYKNNGKTHSRKCELCGEYGAPEAHSFEKHICACGAKETVEMTEKLKYNMANITDGIYSCVGTDFTLTDTDPGLTYGMSIGSDHVFTITANDPSLIIESIEAVVYQGGSDYVAIGVSSGEKEEKGGIDNGTVAHINNINASSFSFVGLSDLICKVTDVTVYYTDGSVAHDFSGDYIDNGDTHSRKCTKCEENGTTESHIYTDGVCVCGAEDPSEFVINSDGVLIRYNGVGGNVVIPGTVVDIAAGVFMGNTAITTVKLPDTVASIGDNAFKDCTGLSEVILPEGELTTIGSYAFAGCTKLTEISIPYGVVGIGSYAFYGCTKLKDLTITDSVMKLLANAFDGDTLENVYYTCLDDGDAIENRMSKFGDFTYIMFPHQVEDGECILCGRTQDEILLDEAKKAAIAELEVLISDDSSDEVLIIIDDACRAIIDDAQDVADVEEILNAAKADVAAQIAAEALAKAKKEALDIITTFADADASDKVKAIIVKAVSDVYSAGSPEEVKKLVTAAEKAVAEQKAAEALAEAKDAAETEVANAAADCKYADTAAAYVAACDDIDNAETEDELEKAVADIKEYIAMMDTRKDSSIAALEEKALNASEAGKAVIAQAIADIRDCVYAAEVDEIVDGIDDDVAAAELAEAKKEAKTAVEALAGDTASDEVKAVVEKALADIELAEDKVAVEAITAAAEKAVADQKAAEETAAAELAEAKKEAKTAIDAALADDADEAVKAAAEEAKAAIDNAKTTEEVEAAKNAGLEKMANSTGVCPYCGAKEHRTFLDKIFCIIHRIIIAVGMIFSFVEKVKSL